MRKGWLALSAAALMGLSTTGHTATPIEGEFAMPGVTPGVAGELVATPEGSALDLKLDVMFRRPAEKNALKRYETVLGEQMQINVVSDDLQLFFDRRVAHVIDGHGQVRIRFPKPGLYHVYADATPRTLPRQIVRFDLTVGDAGTVPSRALGGPVAEAQSGPYTVRFNSLNLAAGRDLTLGLHILENGKPAKDLHPFLGEPAQAMLISVDDLNFIPLVTGTGSDAMPEDSPVPANLTFRVRAPKPGTYRLFVEFSGGRMTYAAPFVAVSH